MDALLLLVRTLHLLFVISWIGRLYWINFAESPFLLETNIRSRDSTTISWWRWSPLGVVVTGFVYLLVKRLQIGSWQFLDGSYGVFMLTGAALGLVMAANLWLVMRPLKRKVKAAAAGLGPVEAARAAAGNLQRLGFATRTNTLFSLPVIFLMGAAPHYVVRPWEGLGWRPAALCGVLAAAVVAALEFNGLVGHAGFGKRLLESRAAVAVSAVVFGTVLFVLAKLMAGAGL